MSLISIQLANLLVRKRRSGGVYRVEKKRYVLWKPGVRSLVFYIKQPYITLFFVVLHQIHRGGIKIFKKGEKKRLLLLSRSFMILHKFADNVNKGRMEFYREHGCSCVTGAARRVVVAHEEGSLFASLFFLADSNEAKCRRSVVCEGTDSLTGRFR